MLSVPARSDAFTVFAQQSLPALDVAAVVRQAAKFFAAELAIEGVPAAGGEPAARIRVGGVARSCFGREATSDDHDAAREAEERAGYTGMSLLAARCGVVWLVAVESAPDTVALRLAAILASVLLGPILSPDGTELFGVKTARAKLEH